MLGLLGTLEMGSRSLQTQRQGLETTGQNLANVNNTSYARQRIVIKTSINLPSSIGPIGTGAEVVGIQQYRDAFLDHQIQTETSVGGYLEAQRGAYESLLSSLGEQIDRQSATTGTSAVEGAGTSHGLMEDLAGLFESFQKVASSPASITERQQLVSRASVLASHFNTVDGRVKALLGSLNDSVASDVSKANTLLDGIADLNQQILEAEHGSSIANDMRDMRQQKIEELTKLANVETVTDDRGSVSVTLDGHLLVADKEVVERLESYLQADGRTLVRAQNAGVDINFTGGTLGGNLDARDGGVIGLRQQLNDFASMLISEVNAIHRSGFSLTGTTGEDFFTGTGADDIQLNSQLAAKPELVQAAGVSGVVGDNTVALQLAQLADKQHLDLNNQTFVDDYALIVAKAGGELSAANGKLEDHQLVNTMLTRQRESVGGVSIDEEMTNLVKYQKAFEASARIITTVNEMLDTVLSLKR